MNDEKLGYYKLFLEKTKSTNTYASSVMEPSQRRHGMLVYTYEQTAGRGQRANAWQTAAGQNLTFSLILTRLLPRLDLQFSLNTVFSLAIVEFLNSLGIDKVHIKWPNDIWVQQKKIAGILIENAIQQSALREVIVGIGLNVNQTQFPDELIATSLTLEKGIKFDLDQTQEGLLDFINREWQNYIDSGSPPLLERYNQKLLNKNEWTKIMVVNDGRVIIARPLEVIADGRIVFQNTQNTRMLFRNGDIRWQLSEEKQHPDEDSEEDDFLGI